jgi:ABC-type transport system substrate-binding protein
VAVPSLVDSFDPTRPADAAHRLALGLVHETLIRIGPDGRLAPGLARGWSRGASDREWVLELDPEARFHDDAAVTAADVLRSLRRFLDAQTPAAVELAARLLPDGLSAADARHVVLRFRDPQPEAPLLLAAGAAAITSPSGAGAGPFLPTHRVPGRRVALTAFAEHVRGRPYLDRVTLTLVAEESQRAADLAGGRVDAALDAGPAAPAGEFATLILAMDPTRPPFDSPPARAAIAEAIRSADIPAFLPGALAPHVAPASNRTAPPRGPLALTVADDVPVLASQRIAAVLDSLGARVRVEPRSPEAARTAATPLRLLLEVPEAPLGMAIAAERRALASGVEGAAVPIASLPLRLATAARLHGASIGRDGIARLEDAWIEP